MKMANTCCECGGSGKVRPFWRGSVVYLCGPCKRKGRLSNYRLFVKDAKLSHLEAWKKTRSMMAPVVQQKALEDMTAEELRAEIERLSV
jgi:hypothetical protein